MKFQTLNSIIKRLFLVPHQGSFSLQEMETFVKNHNQSKCLVVNPSPNKDTSTIELNLRLWVHFGKEGSKKCKSQWNWEFPVNKTVSPSNVRNYTERVIPTDCLDGASRQSVEKKSERTLGFNLTQRSIGNLN